MVDVCKNKIIALTETWEQEYSVSVVTSVIGEYTQEAITDENREALMEGLGGAGDWITFPLSELRTFEGDYANVDGHLVSYIGTYYEESQKQVVLDAIMVAIQTTDIL